MHQTLSEHLEKLRYFVVIADQGSFAQAAHQLKMTQPTLSLSIKKLEEVLDKKLFYRASTGISLTPAGKELKKFAQKILLETNQIEHILNTLEEAETARLIVGTKEPHAMSVWPLYLEHFAQATPQLEIVLRVMRSNKELVQQLQKGELDLVFIPEPERQEGVLAYEIFPDAYAVFGAPKYLAGKSKNELLDAPLYVFLNSLCGKGSISRVLSKKSVDFNLCDVDSHTVAQKFALRGLGLALLPEVLAMEEVKSNALQKIPHPFIHPEDFGEMKMCLCYLERNEKNRHFVQVRKILRKIHAEFRVRKQKEPELT